MEPQKSKFHEILGIRYSEEFLNNKYNHLLSIFIIFFLVAPFIDMQLIHFPFSGVIFFICIVVTLHTVIDNEYHYHVATFIISGAFIVFLLARYKIIPQFIHVHVSIISVFIFTISLFIAIGGLIKKISEEKVVNNDTVKGGICLYLLIGLAYAQVYFFIYLFDQNAFSVQNIHLGDVLYFQYYSFTVLTTLGFGDITPLNKIAMNVSYLEAITGQMVIAVFIARLIGLNMFHDKEKITDVISKVKEKIEGQQEEHSCHNKNVPSESENPDCKTGSE